jgi:hypothetical protein
MLYYLQKQFRLIDQTNTCRYVQDTKLLEENKKKVFMTTLNNLNIVVHLYLHDNLRLCLKL